MVRCPRDERVARPSAMIHLLPVTPWIMAVFVCHVSMLPAAPPNSMTIREERYFLSPCSIPTWRDGAPDNHRRPLRFLLAGDSHRHRPPIHRKTALLSTL